MYLEGGERVGRIQEGNQRGGSDRSDSGGWNWSVRSQCLPEWPWNDLNYFVTCLRSRAIVGVPVYTECILHPQHGRLHYDDTEQQHHAIATSVLRDAGNPLRQ